MHLQKKSVVYIGLCGLKPERENRGKKDRLPEMVNVKIVEELVIGNTNFETPSSRHQPRHRPPGICPYKNLQFVWCPHYISEVNLDDCRSNNHIPPRKRKMNVANIPHLTKKKLISSFLDWFKLVS